MVKERKPIPIGTRFGRLTFIGRADDGEFSNGKKYVRYKCLCDCGNEKIIAKAHLVSGSIRSCGCLQKETMRSARLKHGDTHKHRLYGVWLNMKDRCYNPHNNHYDSYGGRGVRVCDEWLHDYPSFRDWCLSNGYKEEIRESGRNNLTLDRIDVDGNYEPANCRFVSNKENCLNKRDNLSNEERYKVCPVCGKPFEVKKRNQQQTCSASCGQIIRSQKLFGKIERNADGTFKKITKSA